MKRLFIFACALGTLAACTTESNPVGPEHREVDWNAAASADSLQDNGGMAGGNIAECGENGGMAGGNAQSCGEP